jgi:hypothetical protein
MAEHEWRVASHGACRVLSVRLWMLEGSQRNRQIAPPLIVGKNRHNAH